MPARQLPGTRCILFLIWPEPVKSSGRYRLPQAWSGGERAPENLPACPTRINPTISVELYKITIVGAADDHIITQTALAGRVPIAIAFGA